MLFGEQPAGATEPGLNLVENQDDVVARTNLADRSEIAGRRNDHARLALNWFDQEGDRVGRDRRFERCGVAKGHNVETGREGAETVARGCVGAEADDRQSAAVEIVGADDDFGLILRHTLNLIAPFARNLDRAFHRFGTRVHGQDLVRTGGSAEFLAEQRELIVHESPRGYREPRCLLGERRQDARVAVPLIDRRIRRQTIEVAAAVDIPNPDAEAAGQHYFKRLVVARAVLALKDAIVRCRRVFQHDIHREPLRSVRTTASHYSAARRNALAFALW